MKKIISLTIVIVTLLSLFTVPVEAAFLDETIYMSLSFETEAEAAKVVDKTNGNHDLNWVYGDGMGANGTKGAVKIKEKAATGDIKIDVPNVGDMKNKAIKVSYWAKWDTEANEEVVDRLLRPGAVVYFDSGYIIGCDFSKGADAAKELMKGAWMYYEVEVPYANATYSSSKTPCVENGEWVGVGMNNVNFNYNTIKTSGISVLPRLFEASGGNINSCIGSGSGPFPANGITWYMDDFKIEVVDIYDKDTNIPVVSELTLDNDNFVGDAVMSYSYTPTENAAESKAVITISKQLADGKTAILKQDICNTATSKNQETGKVEYKFKITEGMLNEKLAFSVLPFDKTATSEYIQGEAVVKKAEKAVAHKYVITPGTFAFGSDSITASLAVTNNTADALDIFMIVALYDAEGHLVGYDNSQSTKSLQVAGNSTLNTNNSLTVSVSANVKSAKAFFWEGTSIDNVVAQGIANSQSATK